MLSLRGKLCEVCVQLLAHDVVWREMWPQVQEVTEHKPTDTHTHSRNPRQEQLEAGLTH